MDECPYSELIVGLFDRLQVALHGVVVAVDRIDVALRVRLECADRHFDVLQRLQQLHLSPNLRRRLNQWRLTHSVNKQ